jgi:hypothetical protein
MTASSTSAEVLASSFSINTLQIENRLVLGPKANRSARHPPAPTAVRRPLNVATIGSGSDTTTTA